MKTKLIFPIIFSFLFFSTSVSAEATIAEIQKEWAQANYATEKAQQADAFTTLVKKARGLVQAQPNKAEPKVWLAIVLGTEAGVTGGLSALGKVKEAKKLLEAAETIDANVLNGSVYTSLGSLYYQVPGWPIGFGKSSKAEEYLQKALSINPKGIDPNYFYGDFMLEEGDFGKAVQYLERAKQAPARPNRPLADQGRQKEIAEKLAIAKSKLKH